jgi:hypothetical protein
MDRLLYRLKNRPKNKLLLRHPKSVSVAQSGGIFSSFFQLVVFDAINGGRYIRKEQTWGGAVLGLIF